MKSKELILYYQNFVDTDKHKYLIQDIIDFISKDTVSHFYLTPLFDQFGEKYSKKELLFIIQKLIIGKYNLLDIAYTFYDDDDDEFPITKSEYKEIEEFQSYIHPISGEEIPFEKFISNTVYHFVVKKENFLV